MQTLEVNDYVVRLFDTIRREPNFAHRINLLVEARLVVDEQFTELVKRTAYAMRDAGLSNEDVAVLLDVHPATVSRYTRDFGRANHLPTRWRSGPKPGETVLVAPLPKR